MKILKKIKDSLYHLLVKTNVHAKYRHHRYKGQIGKPYSAGVESELSRKITPEDYSVKLLRYDIISFDVFDTLLFRPFQKPADLFYIVGQKLEYTDFTGVRIQAEQTAREKMRQNKHTGEINIYDIYEYLEKYCGVNAKDGVSAEYETEFDLLYPNPFMKRVYDILVGGNKKIIAVTDMYLTKEMIKNILNNCGYADIFEIFVSNEYGCGKHDGKLFEKVKNKIGGEYSYVHIGDNWVSDFKNPKKYKIDSLYYIKGK